MEGLDRVAAHIAAESRAEAAELIRRAQADCAQMLQEAQTAAEALRVQLRAQAEDQAEALGRQRLAAAELEARKRLLALRQELVADGIRLVLEALGRLQGPELETFLTRLALGARLTGSEEVILSPRDRETAGEALTARLNRELAAQGRPASLKLSARVLDRAGGLILRQGGVETDCTFEGLLRLKRGEVSALLASLLFSREEGGAPDETDS